MMNLVCQIKSLLTEADDLMEEVIFPSRRKVGLDRGSSCAYQKMGQAYCKLCSFETLTRTKVCNFRNYDDMKEKKDE